MKRSVSTAWNSRLFLMPASVSAGDLLLVALKIPPSRIGTYSNFTPVRFSIAGIASWLRKALGLPKSNRNCGLVLKAVSRMTFAYCGARDPARLQYHDGHNIVDGVTDPAQTSRCRDRLRRLGAVAEGELDDVVADIVGPAGHQGDEASPVVGEQRPRGFLEAGEIASHGRHETIGGLLCRARAIRIAVGAARL